MDDYHFYKPQAFLGRQEEPRPVKNVRGPSAPYRRPPASTVLVMIEDQGGNCGLCGEELLLTSRHHHIDHDHTTGKVRDVVCVRCNLLLGMAEDSIRRLEEAIAYLKRHGKE